MEKKELGRARKFPVVGIGASAGGLEAVQQLLENIPDNPGMSFVVVQHLNPEHKSELTSILSRVARVPVVEARSGQALQRNRAYVIPSNKCMHLQNGRLKLTARSKMPGPPLIIDTFLRSLASERGHKAIGVILSGTASDGAEGLKAIKAEGGITFAQDEKTAKYSGMPRTAVATGCVDFIMPPEKIAKKLSSLTRHPYVRRTAACRPGGRENVMPKIFRLLHQAAGVEFSDYSPNVVQRRIQRRMALQKIDNLERYADFLDKQPAEIDCLYEDLLLSVTSFFRDPPVFQMLAKRVLPNLVESRRKNKKTIRIWVPGCASGEEVYSLAILLEEYGQARRLSIPCQFFGTDLSQQALVKARNGIYPPTIQTVVNPQRLHRFFTKIPSGYQINKAIRDRCVFARHNLAQDPPFLKLDLISCRNLLIYLGTGLRERILPLFHSALRPNGYLLLGALESISGFEHLFASEDKKRRIFVRRMEQSRKPVPFNGGHPPLVKSVQTVQREADQTLLDRFAPASVLVDEAGEILQFRGRTGAYLESSAGLATLNVLKMAREGLLGDLQAALHQARDRGKPIRKNGISVKTDGKERQINLEVWPLKGANTEGHHYLVLFEHADHGPSAARNGPELPVDLPGKNPGKRISRLERELKATKSYMRSMVEELEGSNQELRVANEEIQSSNEELQTANEELETAKEELQSINEELLIVNEELQNRNVELGRLNNDVNNLLTSVNLPILMLSPNLRVRRMTPVAESVLHLHHADIGRSIRDLHLPMQIRGLVSMVRVAMRTGVRKQREIKDNEGHWYSLQVHPYRTDENKTAGAVLAFLDVNALKCSLQDAEQCFQFAEGIVNTIRKPLLVLEPDLRVRSANRAFLKSFGVTTASILHRFVYDLDGGKWNNSELRRLLEEILPKHTVFEGFKMTLEDKIHGQRHLLLNARQLRGDHDASNLILLAMEDITDRLRLQKSVLDIGEQERERMGRDLHDGLAQQFAGIAFMNETLCKELRGAPPKVSDLCFKITKRLKEANHTIHDLARGLVPTQLKNEGFLPALEALLANVRELFNVTCRFTYNKSVKITDENSARHLYRITQEAVYNAVKHSHGNVALNVDSRLGQIVVTVRDDGRGFVKGKEDRQHMGLRLMDYRAQLIGATLKITSARGKGTTVVCSLPMANSQTTGRTLS